MPSAIAELEALGTFDGRRILDAIARQLTHQPSFETRNRKMLPGLIPPFDADPPLWELRVGNHRVFYDIDSEAQTVYVRAVRVKPPHLTTDQVL